MRVNVHRTLLAVYFCVSAALAARAQAAPTLTVFPAPRVARVLSDQTIFREGPGSDYDRRTPLLKGTWLVTVGRAGTWLECDLGGGDRGWVEEKDVECPTVLPSPVAGQMRDNCPLALNLVRNVLVRPGQDETCVDLQLTQRTSFDVVETLSPPMLTVRLHRSNSMMFEIAQYSGNSTTHDVEVQEPRRGVVEVKIPLNGPGLWGWHAQYGVSPRMATDPPGHDFSHISAETLRLTIRNAPLFKRLEGDMFAPDACHGITVVVDPGHGGTDNGAIGLNGLKEKDINLACALALRDALRRRGVTVVMTRETDRDVATVPADELEKRVQIGRDNRATLFISIHHNARPIVADGRVAHGTFVYYYQPQSADLAEALAGPVATAQGEAVRAYVFRSFAVIRESDFPAVLIEVGFISNPNSEEKMRAPGYATQIGEAIASGVDAFFQRRFSLNGVTLPPPPVKRP